MLKKNEYSFLVADEYSFISNRLCLFVNDLFAKVNVIQTEQFDTVLRLVKETKFDLLLLAVNSPEGNNLGF